VTTSEEQAPATGDSLGSTDDSSSTELSTVIESLAALAVRLDSFDDGFSKYRKQTNDDLKRLRRRDVADESEPSNGAAQSASISGGEELAAALKIQRSLSGIPDEIASEMLDRIGAGETSSAILREVDAIRRGMSLGPANGKPTVNGGGMNGNTKPPRDSANSGPRQNSTPRPVNRKEFARLMQKDRASAVQLLRDESFNLENLPA